MSAVSSQAEPFSDGGMRFERLLADLSARFVNPPPSEVDPEIEQGLRLIGEALEVDRCSLLEFSEDGTQLLTTHQWANEGIASSRGRVVSEETPWFTRVLKRGETVAYSTPADLPDEAVREKEFCARTGLLSNLTIPLKVSGRGLGALAIGCFRRERAWPAELVPRLRLLGEVFANALVRRNQSVSLEQALAEVRELKARLEEENLYLRKEIAAVTRAGGGCCPCFMVMSNLTRPAAFVPARSPWTFPRCTPLSRGIPRRYAVWLAVLWTALAAPAWAEEIAASRTLLWFLSLAAPPAESQGAFASAGERLTLDDAIALALDANRLVKKPERLQLISEGVIQAYDGVLRAQRALEVREAALRMCRELDRVTAEQADRGEALPSVVCEAGAARAKATSDVLSARRELDAWNRQLNHLMGRDAQARLRATGEPGAPPAAAIWLGVTATGK